jgi:hypothetical protein
MNWVARDNEWVMEDDDEIREHIFIRLDGFLV